MNKIEKLENEKQALDLLNLAQKILAEQGKDVSALEQLKSDKQKEYIETEKDIMADVNADAKTIFDKHKEKIERIAKLFLMKLVADTPELKHINFYISVDHTLSFVDNNKQAKEHFDVTLDIIRAKYTFPKR